MRNPVLFAAAPSPGRGSNSAASRIETSYALEVRLDKDVIRDPVEIKPSVHRG